MLTYLNSDGKGTSGDWYTGATAEKEVIGSIKAWEGQKSEMLRISEGHLSHCQQSEAGTMVKPRKDAGSLSGN